MRRISAWAVVWAGLLAAGCAPAAGPLGGPATLGRVDRLDLWVAPAALDLDGQGGPDGVNMRLYLYEPGVSSQPGLASAGQFEFLLYEGRLDPSDAPGLPGNRWQYTAGELRGFFMPDKYGLGCYQATLSWPPGKSPASSTVTLVARYTDPAGRVISSSPANILMRAK